MNNKFEKEALKTIEFIKENIFPIFPNITFEYEYEPEYDEEGKVFYSLEIISNLEPKNKCLVSIGVNHMDGVFSCISANHCALYNGVKDYNWIDNPRTEDLYILPEENYDLIEDLLKTLNEAKFNKIYDSSDYKTEGEMEIKDVSVLIDSLNSLEDVSDVSLSNLISTKNDLNWDEGVIKFLLSPKISQPFYVYINLSIDNKTSRYKKWEIKDTTNVLQLWCSVQVMKQVFKKINGKIFYLSDSVLEIQNILKPLNEEVQVIIIKNKNESEKEIINMKKLTFLYQLSEYDFKIACLSNRVYTFYIEVEIEDKIISFVVSNFEFETEFNI